MNRKHLLEAKAIPGVNGGNVQIPLRGLPPGYRVREIVLSAEAVITCGGAAVLIPGKELPRVFQNIEIGKNVKGSGVRFWTENWIMRGRESYLPASIPATNAGVFRRTIQVIIPYGDGLSWNPADGMRETEQFQAGDEQISVDFAALAALDTGSNNWNNLANFTGTLRAWAILEERGVKPSGQIRMGYKDFATQQILLDPGLYTHIWLFKETAATITSLEVATVALKADGRPVADVMRSPELVTEWNADVSDGTGLHADSATVPVPGQRLTQEPTYGNGDAATVTMEVLPIAFQPRAQKLSRLLPILQGGVIDLTGTLTSGRLGFRRYDARTEGEAVDALRLLGHNVTSAQQIKAATENGRGLGDKGFLTRFFPLDAA